MIKLLTKEIYKEPTMSKMTSIVSGPSRDLKWIYNNKHFNGKVIDYGCGKVARNSIYLREQGLQVYSYDPYWGKPNVNGWKDISKDLPTDKFDIGFTCFVLNVVNIIEENEILNWMKSHCNKDFHITRNKDISSLIRSSLKKQNKRLIKFLKKHLSFDETKPYTEEDIENIAHHGILTVKGFQRIPELKDKEYKLIKIKTGVKIYERE
jgi:hypothetical protein